MKTFFAEAFSKMAYPFKAAFKKGGEYILVGIGSGIKGICGLYPYLIIVSIAGMFLVMIGKYKLGTKITSGSIIAYIICKGIAS